MNYPKINILIPVNHGLNLSIDSSRLSQCIKNSLNPAEIESVILEIDQAVGSAEVTAAVIGGLLDSMNTEVKEADLERLKQLRKEISEIFQRS